MLKTEMRNPKSIYIDKMDTIDILKTINTEDRSVPLAVFDVIEDIAKAVDMIAEALDNGGRLIYVGAGTSGRLGVLDAAECPPTFGIDKKIVIPVIAGGSAALTSASEDKEDNAEQGRADIEALGITNRDIVVGISASGGAAYVIAAMKSARAAGAHTVGIICNKGSEMEKISDIAITPDTGPEVITGSTRLKAGTAQKLILNMLSTGAMIKTGKVYENYMINLKPVNKKLLDRCIRIITDITGTDRIRAEAELRLANGSIREAIDSIKAGEGECVS
ncbi:MAG: N-acetylmuramic acid 6-phosphate etherase [Clostridiales bacterium]|nr:N-acetylmuramic acid 6-phosphate etherase [Clostridiales bacterium]